MLPPGVRETERREELVQGDAVCGIIGAIIAGHGVRWSRILPGPCSGIALIDNAQPDDEYDCFLDTLSLRSPPPLACAGLFALCEAHAVSTTSLLNNELFFLMDAFPLVSPTSLSGGLFALCEHYLSAG